MANHVPLDQSKPLGNQYRYAASLAKDLRDYLKNLRDASTPFLTGDSGLDASYDGFVANGVGTTTAEAHNAFTQLDTLVNALSTNADQTAVLDKLTQFITYLGGN